MKFLEKVGNGPLNKWLNFRADPIQGSADPYRDTGKTCLGAGMHCPSPSSSESTQNCELPVISVHFGRNDVNGPQPHGAIRTETDLLALVGRQNEREQRQHGDERARDDEVEAVVESSTSDVDAERDVYVRLRAALIHLDLTSLVHLDVSHGRSVYTP